jgi:TetR/AcrR family transcriptional regulator, transcriptional repressor for nem operon
MAKRPAAARKRTNDPQAMRRRVLDVAALAFQSGGYHSTSTHDIMREAGVTGGALHHHFPTKKAIALAVLRERVAQAVEQTWIAPVRSARTVADGIRDIFAGTVAALDDRGRVLGCPLNNLALELSLADPDLRNEIETIFDRWREAITGKLRADGAAGTEQSAPAEDLATLVVATYSGAMAMAKAEQSTAPLKVCARQLAALLRPRGRKPSSR